MIASVGASLRKVVAGHAATLADAGVDSPLADASALARHVLDVDTATLRTATAGTIDSARLRRLEQVVARRAARTPLQHLTGEVGFRQLALTCRPGVFVPRPETELLAGAAVAAARAALVHSGTARVVEPCTGTGAVALSVATEVDGVEVVATDRSPDACRLARENLQRLTAEGRLGNSVCRVLVGDLLQPVPSWLLGRVDVVVANPPYLTPDEVAASPPEVRIYEPLDALLGGPDGNAVVERLLRDGLRWLRPGGHLLLEVGESRAAHLATRACALGYVEVGMENDLAGRSRILVARLRAEGGRERRSVGAHGGGP
ncbi:MAG TPA: peptide chain release factor N(5)-glutamine methyltransferase [Nitriliruptorales bacterium]|nr:peptide chain release factor N(5)-glutamine methyltransferase [Nitriliruptorales bacterium]